MEGILLLIHGFVKSVIGRVHVIVYVQYTHLLYCYTLLYAHACVCVCADVCVLCPSLGMQRRSIFVPHISHQYFTPSPPLPSSLSPSLFLGHQNKVLSMLRRTPLKDWLAGWNPVGTIWVASGAIKKLPPPDGCKQSFRYLFLTFIYPR